MSFLRRVQNTATTFGFAMFRDYVALPHLETILDASFPEDKNRPSLIDLERNAGFMLSYTHPLMMDGLRPTSHNYVPIGMLSCRPKDVSPLPKDIRTFMDESGEDGVIFVSFGSVLTASKMDEAMRLKLVSVFKKLKQRVLWKWETEEMVDKPSNVKLGKWLPQKDILAHPKLKLFVTHAGQSSSQEALCYQKPIVSRIRLFCLFCNSLLIMLNNTYVYQIFSCFDMLQFTMQMRHEVI